MNIYQFNLSLGGQTSAKEMQATLDRSEPVNDRTPAAVLEDRAAALNNLGVVYVQRKDGKTAEPLFAEAAALYEQLPGKGSEGMAICLANAGALYDDMQFYQKAEKAYMAAREIYERLALGDPEKHNPYFSKLLMRLGNLYAAEGKYRLAETALLEGIGILEILVKDDPEGYRQDMIDVLTGLAALYTAMRDWEEAERRLQWALTLSEGMGVALIHKRLGDLYSRKGDADAGKEHYEMAMEGYTSFSEDGGLLAQALIGYASLCYEQKDYATAKELFLRAQEICESLIPTNRDAAESDLAAILHYLAGVYRREKNAEGEAAALTRMSQLSVLHAKFNPIQGPLRADVLLNLASGYAMKKDFIEAKEAYLSALEVFDWLENVNPGMYQSTQAAVLHSLGSLYRDFGHLREAESAYNRSITIRNKLAVAYPSIYEAVLARTYISLAKLYVKMEEKRRSISAYKLAVPLFERLAVEDASMYESELLHLYHALAAALLEEKDRTAAREVWEKALPIEERRVETDPAGHETSLIYTLLNLANINGYDKEYRQAELQYKKALLIKLQFRDRQPEKFDHDTAKILRGLGRSYAREENWTEAEETLMRSLQLYDQLEAAQPGVYTAKKEDVLTILEKVYSDSAGEGEPTVTIMELRLAMYQQLDAIHPGTHGPRIAELLTALAGEYADADNTEGALDARLQANAIFSTLIDNGWLEYRPPLAESLLWLAILQEQRNDFDAAEKAYRECLEVYTAMAADNGPAFHLKQANALMYYGKYLLRLGQADAGKQRIDQAAQLSKAYAGD